jgi:hypothetical protein
MARNWRARCGCYRGTNHARLQEAGRQGGGRREHAVRGAAGGDIDAILADANPHEVLMVCAHALAQVAPDRVEQLQAEFEAELLRHVRECVARQQEADDDTPPVRH